uniref:Helicase ATP-binding domain-containing protein n=1 Tax=Octopus bimaculoides TaxID=37653 RepID=A0A0L8I4R2_OCTBM
MPLLNVMGVNINFPFKPYECQKDYMKKVITCLQENQNGLLESPTGTGKTLCLLCSTLAWLQDYKAQVALKKQGRVQEFGESSKDEGNIVLDSLSNQLTTSTGASWGEAQEFEYIGDGGDDDDDDDDNCDDGGCDDDDDDNCDDGGCDDDDDCSDTHVAPKIIYASRTHSQLTQVVQELKRSAYSRSVNLGT